MPWVYNEGPVMSGKYILLDLVRMQYLFGGKQQKSHLLLEI